jgi:hypothetical protein
VNETKITSNTYYGSPSSLSAKSEIDLYTADATVDPKITLSRIDNFAVGGATNYQSYITSNSINMCSGILNAPPFNFYYGGQLLIYASAGARQFKGVADSANVAYAVSVNSNTTPTLAYPTFVSVSTGNTSLYTGTMTYNASTNVLSTNISGGCTTILVADQQTSANYYLPFVSGTSGQQSVYIDASSPLQYNPVSNLLTVGALALNTGTTGVVYSAGALSLTVSGTGGQSTQEFKWNATSAVGTVNTFNITNRRGNAIYRIYIINSTGVSFTINGSLAGTATNKTSFPNTTIPNGATYIMKIQVVDFNTGNNVNAIDLVGYS